MRIASKTNKTALLSGAALGLVLVLGAGAFPALAADNIAAPPPAVLEAPAPALTVASSEAPAASGAAAQLTPAASAAARSKNIAALEDKVTDSVKNVVKQLATVDSVNLDDLNTARQTVTKLEVLIDIEKHLAELDKLRADHSGEKTIAAAIPASALAPPVSLSSTMRPHTLSADMFAMESGGHIEVTRVSGSDGRYTALIGGKFFQVGDKLSDGSTIVGISSREVSTKSKDGTIHQLKIKGIKQVYGNSL